jgi:Mn-dependent DtxR family transcriptional regulator
VTFDRFKTFGTDIMFNLSSWLVMLGVDPRIAAEDACKIEHDVSAESFEAIKRHINSVSK